MIGHFHRVTSILSGSYEVIAKKGGRAMDDQINDEKDTLHPKYPILSVDPDICVPFNRAGTAFSAARIR